MEASNSRHSSPLSLLSSPLSERSRSPSLPCDYPSPSLTGSRSPSKSREVPLDSIECDGPPPSKKRKLVEPKLRTTEYLDLRALEETINGKQNAKEEEQLQRLLTMLRKKRKIVVIAGAGISVSAGIPDFRSSSGLFSTLRGQHKLKASGKHLFDAAVYKTDSSTTSFHAMVRELSHLTRSAQPTLFHHMLATLAEEGRLMRLYTQNVDGIDTALEPLATTVPLNPKGPWPRTIQLHGGLEKMVCTKCGELSNFNGALFEGPKPPSCISCEALEHVRTTVAGKRSHGVGRLRPRIVLYNEFNPDEEAIGAVTRTDIRNRPDAVIVVGTSLKVPGVRRIAREMCAAARSRRDGFTAWINNGPEPMGNEFKGCWDLVVRGDCDAVARHAALPRWDDKSLETYNCVAGPNTGTMPTVVLEITDKVLEKKQGILTPTASPRHQSPVPLKAVRPRQHKLALKLSLGGSKPPTETLHIRSAKKKTLKTTKKSAAQTSSIRITSSFNVTKAKLVSGELMKTTPVVEIPARRQSLVFPSLISSKFLETATESISSEYQDIDRRASGRDDSELLKSQASASFGNIKPYNNVDTVSPKGNIPNGMARLLN